MERNLRHVLIAFLVLIWLLAPTWLVGPQVAEGQIIATVTDEPFEFKAQGSSSQIVWPVSDPYRVVWRRGVSVETSLKLVRSREAERKAHDRNYGDAHDRDGNASLS